METISSGQKKCYIECSCGTELVQVISDFEVFENSPNPFVRQEYYLSFYSLGHVRKYNFWSRIRHAWKILRTGEPYADMVVLTSDEAMKLSDFVRDNLVTQKPTQINS